MGKGATKKVVLMKLGLIKQENGITVFIMILFYKAHLARENKDWEQRLPIDAPEGELIPTIGMNRWRGY